MRLAGWTSCCLCPGTTSCQKVSPHELGLRAALIMSTPPCELSCVACACKSKHLFLKASCREQILSRYVSFVPAELV